VLTWLLFSAVALLLMSVVVSIIDLTTGQTRILGVLAGGGEFTGHQIQKLASVSAGSIYVLLMRMEDEGLIEGRWLNERSPRRRVYRMRQP
jgi:DNA-binding PadR family transcriptional regulator